MPLLLQTIKLLVSKLLWLKKRVEKAIISRTLSIHNYKARRTFKKIHKNQKVVQQEERKNENDYNDHTWSGLTISPKGFFIKHNKVIGGAKKTNLFIQRKETLFHPDDLSETENFIKKFSSRKKNFN